MAADSVPDAGSARRGTPDLALPMLDPAGSGGPRMKRSRATAWRAGVLITIHVFIAVRVLLWLRSGTAVTPLEPSESMELVSRGIVNAGLILFALALLSTLILGRWFCGWACHVVALQDLCYGLMRRIGIRPKPFRSRLLIYVPFILAMYMFVWPAVYRWGLVPLSTSLHGSFSWIPALTAPPWPGARVELTTEDFWGTFPGVFVAVPFLFVCGFATVYFLGAKGFCTYGCPYGGLFAPLDQFAPGRIRVNDDCEHCGHCTAACTSNVRVHEEVAAYGMVVDPGCMKCMDCVSVCPNDALSFGFGPLPGKAVKEAAKPAPKRHDLTWPQEVVLSAVFAGTFFAVRGVYELVPMLMAAGLAGCVTFIAWTAWRTLRQPNAAFHRWRLATRGRPTRTGVVFVGFAVVTLAAVAHSGGMRLLHRAADRADGEVAVARQQIFSSSPVQLPDEMLDSASTALARYQRLQPFWRGGLALAPWPGVDIRMAWLEACRHDFAAAEALMRRHMETFEPNDRVARDVVLLKSLQLRDADAIAWGRQHLEAHPAHYETAQQVATLMAQEGQVAEASELLRSLVARLEPAEGRRPKPKAVSEHLQILRVHSIFLLDSGQLAEGIAAVERTLEIDPESGAAWQVLARARIQAGRLDDAVRAAEEAWARLPVPEFAGFIAAALEDDGRIMEAGLWRDRALPPGAALEGPVAPR